MEPRWHAIWEPFWKAVDGVQLPLLFHTFPTTRMIVAIFPGGRGYPINRRLATRLRVPISTQSSCCATRQQGPAMVESERGALAVGLTYLLPLLSSGCGSVRPASRVACAFLVRTPPPIPRCSG